MTKQEPEATVRSEWGLACPKCGDDTHIQIQGTAWMTLSVEGTDANDSDHEWTPESAAYCEECGHTGTVGTFQVEEAQS